MELCEVTNCDHEAVAVRYGRKVCAGHADEIDELAADKLRDR